MEVESFGKSLRWKFRWWLLGLPCGVGMATAKSCIRLWLGLKESGVYSAGNGPAMRSALIGAYFADNIKLRELFVRVSTELTHTEPMAYFGAEVVANLAALFTRNSNATDQDVLDVLTKMTDADESGQWALLLNVNLQMDLERFLEMNGCSEAIGGYILDTISSVTFIGRKYQWDYEESVTAIINAGGDTDTTAAILGALCGVKNGAKDIPCGWIRGVTDYPRGVTAIEKLGARIVEHRPPGLYQKCIFIPAIILRNLVFLSIVLGHGFIRMVW